MHCHSSQRGGRQLCCSWLTLSMGRERTEWESGSLWGLQWPSPSGGHWCRNQPALATVRTCFLLRACSASLTPPSMCMGRTDILGQEETVTGKQASLPEFCNYELQGNMKWILLNNLGWRKIYRPSRLYTDRCLLPLWLSWSYLIDLLSALLAGSFPQCLTSNIGVSLIFFSCFCHCLLFPCASKHRKYRSHRWLGFLLFYFKLCEDVLYSKWSCLFNPFFLSRLIMSKWTYSI